MKHIDKLLDPKIDYVFKRIFGYVGNEEITKGLLSSIIQKEISNIKLDNKTILEKDLLEDKVGILDIRAKIEDKINCNIEMQIVDRKNIEKRILYYWSKLYSMNLKAGKDYSSGDKDILLQEIAYAKHRKNVAKTIRENNEQYSVIDYSNALIAGLDVARSWGADIESMGDGGLLGLTMYLYTGKKSDAYFSKSQEHPVCFIDSNGNLSAIENSSSSWNTNLIKEESNVFDKRYDNIDKVIKILKKNTQQDGTFKNYIAEVSLPITNQAIKGQKVIGENHAFTIKAIKDDKVILINPWDSTKEVQISLADFMNSAQMINMLKM